MIYAVNTVSVTERLRLRNVGIENKKLLLRKWWIKVSLQIVISNGIAQENKQFEWVTPSNKCTVMSMSERVTHTNHTLK